MDDRVRDLLISHVGRLMESEMLHRTEERAEEIAGEIRDLVARLKGKGRVGGRRRGAKYKLEEFEAMKSKQGTLELEQGLTLRRITEFKAAMGCILRILRGGRREGGGTSEEEGAEVINFDKKMGFDRIHAMMLRESRRLRDGLPIYSYRKNILDHISANQVVILVGETGSGKSTQLVQFLADFGLAAEGSIVCTQPRRIAALSLQKRVADESCGCYEDDFVLSYPCYQPCQDFDSGIIYTTDTCLLRHCMVEKQLAGVSCIIIDEAHERSLNTDLLLALVKKLLLERMDLRIIIMSATADVGKLADFFYGCYSFHVMGRSFPVDIKYVPSLSWESTAVDNLKQVPMNYAYYVHDTLKMVKTIHETEEDGDVLAFLTSQVEVEWACENFNDPTAVALPMHGKLSTEEQGLVFKSFPGKRKVIFATNIAETSLTIMGVKYVVDCGMEKDSRYDPSSGMNVLMVGWISQSSAHQRAGRAGRTSCGKCYRLYSESEFNLMKVHREPEIRKVHLGTAILRVISLGMTSLEDVEFVDAPSEEAIGMAMKNLIQLGAIQQRESGFELTDVGNCLVKIGIEPRLGKLILDCLSCSLSKEGLVLAAVMANSSSIFCRVGTDADKLRADCLKVAFSHQDGDLFTLLSVYKEWEKQEPSNRNKWCWQHSINAKSMKRCQQSILELEHCLKHEINVIIPSYWLWNPDQHTIHHRSLKRIVLSSLGGNLAMNSGYDKLGYVVASSGHTVQLHPSSSLLVFNRKPDWVVFGEVLSSLNQYLVCVTAVDYTDLCAGSSMFDVHQLERLKLQMKLIPGLGSHLLRRLCGRLSQNLQKVTAFIRKECIDDRITITVDFETHEAQLYATEINMEKAYSIFNDVISREKKWIENECLEKYLFYGGPGNAPPIALFGSGAEIKHLELDHRCLTVEIFHPNANALDDKELICFVDQHVSGIASVHKVAGTGQIGSEASKWGKITFLNPNLAEYAVDNLKVEFDGSSLKIKPVSCEGNRGLPFPAVRARVSWPQRRSKGIALVTCQDGAVEEVLKDVYDLKFGEKYADCSHCYKFKNCIYVRGLPKDMNESEIYNAFQNATSKKIVAVNVFREEAGASPSISLSELALKREISGFIPSCSSSGENFRVEVLKPEPKDAMVKANIIFDGSLHLQAAKALEHLHGRVVAGFLPWQTISCKHVFHSTLSCPSKVYAAISQQVNSLLESFKNQKGVSYTVEKDCNGCYRVRITANATKTIADLRNPLEMLMKGKVLSNPGLSMTVLQLILSRDGNGCVRDIERKTGTCILYDRQSLRVKIFGSPDQVVIAEEEIIRSLLLLHENRQLEICLRRSNLPINLMKLVINRFGPDLHGIKDVVPEVEVSLNMRRHILYVRGSQEHKQKVEDMISELANSSSSSGLAEQSQENSCAICLCDFEEPYVLEACCHMFCRSCLVDQCDSVIKTHEGFPMCCLKPGCGRRIMLVDLKSLLPVEKLDELFRASLSAYVTSQGGVYRYCPTPDCPGVYKISSADGEEARAYVCGACSAETCTKCHSEYHQFITCEKYKEYKEDPDLSLVEWRLGKANVKGCPQCRRVIEKVEGCEHVECRCGSHICWACLECFVAATDCYAHIRAEHSLVQEDWLL